MSGAESWRPVAGYEGAYEVSDLGRVRSVPGGQRHGKVLASRLCGRYLGVSLCVAGVAQNRYVHRLVVEAFIGTRPVGMETCHVDGDRFNNALSNLRYDTHHANMRDTRTHGTSRGWAQTHCKHGHELTKDNVRTLTLQASDGGAKYRRRCRQCDRRYLRASA